MLHQIQEEIKKNQYWDMKVLDLQINYFGDEICIFIYKYSDTCWKITFSVCHQVSYETDADWRQIDNVKMMKRTQLGYYEHDISICENKDLIGFYDVKINLTILNAEITCKEINVETVQNSTLNFFWQENG